MSRGAWLGFTFFVSLVLLGFGTLLIDEDFLAHFKSAQTLTVHFPQIQGLRKGDDVRVDGFRDGKVTQIDLDDANGGVLVKIRLDKPIKLLDDSKIVIEASSVLGGSCIAIHRGTKGAPWTVTPLVGYTQPGLDAVGTMVDENRDNLKQLIANLKDMTQALRDGQGTVGKLLKTDELHKEAVDTLKEAKAAFTEAKGEIKKVGENLTKLTEKVEKGEGPVAHLLNDKKMSQDLEKTLDNVQKTSENLKKITDTVQSGEGALGKLVSDKDMGDKLKRTIDNIEQSSESIKKVTGKLASGEGSIGKLLQDDELYEKAKQTIDDIDRVFAKAARSVVEFVGSSEYMSKEEMAITKLGVRITPSDDKWLYLGASIMSLNKHGDILFRRQIEDNENDTLNKADVLLGYKIPWFLDKHLTVYGGLLETKAGGGVNFKWDDWGIVTHPIEFVFESRSSYTSVETQKLDEKVYGGALYRAYIKTSIWDRRDTWYELLLSSLKFYVGANRIGGRGELMYGTGLEWPDDDLRMLVGFIGLAR